MTTRAIIAVLFSWWFWKLQLMTMGEFVGIVIIILVATIYDMIYDTIREDKK